MAKTRTFIGIVPGGEIVERAERAIARLQAVSSNVKWVERENLHWTLQFMGELDDQEIYKVCQAVQQATEELSLFSMSAVGVGAFPAHSNPRTLWLGVGEGAQAIVELHEAIDQQLAPLGFRGESRRFVPHLTLGRASRGLKPAEAAALAEDLAKLTDYEAGVQVVDEVTVFASRLRREGPEYAVLAKIPLA